MQEDKRYAAYVRKHKQFRNDSEHNGKSSFVAIPRYKYFHCGYFKPVLKKGREDIFL